MVKENTIFTITTTTSIKSVIIINIIQGLLQDVSSQNIYPIII